MRTRGPDLGRGHRHLAHALGWGSGKWLGKQVSTEAMPFSVLAAASGSDSMRCQCFVCFVCSRKVYVRSLTRCSVEFGWGLEPQLAGREHCSSQRDGEGPVGGNNNRCSRSGKQNHPCLSVLCFCFQLQVNGMRDFCHEQTSKRL